MSDKFHHKYRISSSRLQNWDYGSNAMYFITICTHNREHYFGEIDHGKMQLSALGSNANVLWYEIKNHENHIELGEFVVMPNHVQSRRLSITILSMALALPFSALGLT